MDASQRFKVLITGESGAISWYKDYIGDEVYVYNFNQNTYIETSTEKLILHKDCHVIEPTWKVMKDAEETGRKIEWWNKISNKWESGNGGFGYYSNHIYRLAPKPNRPEYEPYGYEDADKLRGLWVQKKDGRHQVMITSIDNNGVAIDVYRTFKQLFEQYKTAIDHQPVGKLKL